MESVKMVAPMLDNRSTAVFIGHDTMAKIKNTLSLKKSESLNVFLILIR